MKFNTDKAGEGVPLHPQGTWDATVVGQEVKKTKTGREMIVLNWKTSQGKLRTWHTWVEEHPFLFLNPMFDMGLTKEFFDAEPEMDDVALELLKRRCMLDVEHEDYMGKQVARVVGYGPIPVSQASKPSKPAKEEPPAEDEPF